MIATKFSYDYLNNFAPNINHIEYDKRWEKPKFTWRKIYLNFEF